MNILVLTDNVALYEGIKRIFEKENKSNIKVQYAHSPIKSEIWNHVDFKNQNKSVDVKDHSFELSNTFDLIISAHCKQFFPKTLVENTRCINIHPGYNPINRGWYPQVFAIVNDLPIGATIHEMDEKLDNGPIIVREFVEKFQYDTSLDIYNRILKLEISLFEKNFKDIIYNTYKTKDVRYEKENYFDKKDFNNLREIKLDQNTSFREAINRLRALSHGEFQNAYFFDSEGNKVYISVTLTKK